MTKGPGDEVERSGSASLEIGLCFAGSCNIRSFIYKELWSCGGGWQVYLVLVLLSKMLWIYSFPYAHPCTKEAQLAKTLTMFTSSTQIQHSGSLTWFPLKMQKRHIGICRRL